MSKDPGRGDVVRILERWGFDVEVIPEVEAKTADLLVTGSERTLLEVKTREDDPHRVAAEDEVLSRGELATGSEAYGYKNRVSGIIRRAVAQLKTYPPGASDLRMLWLRCSGRFEEVQRQQFEATLYGTTQIVDHENSDGSRPAFYFHNSDFFKHRDTLDAAVVSTTTKAQLLVNTLSPNAESVRCSSFAAAFGKAVFDPSQLEAAGEAFVVDSDVDRRDSAAVLRDLQRKTGRKALQSIGMAHHWIMASIPTVPDER